MGTLWAVTGATLTLVESRYIAMPLVLGLMPFAVATVLSARLLRAPAVSAGDQCRTVVDGWKAWDNCMRLRVKNPDAVCPVLQSIINQLKLPDMPASVPLF